MPTKGSELRHLSAAEIMMAKGAEQRQHDTLQNPMWRAREDYDVLHRREVVLRRRLRAARAFRYDSLASESRRLRAKMREGMLDIEIDALRKRIHLHPLWKLQEQRRMHRERMKAMDAEFERRERLAGRAEQILLAPVAGASVSLASLFESELSHRVKRMTLEPLDLRSRGGLRLSVGWELQRSTLGKLGRQWQDGSLQTIEATYIISQTSKKLSLLDVMVKLDSRGVPSAKQLRADDVARSGEELPEWLLAMPANGLPMYSDAGCTLPSFMAGKFGKATLGEAIERVGREAFFFVVPAPPVAPAEKTTARRRAA